jgi:hypothetical protein
MTPDQLLLFEQSHRLADVSLLDRLAGAEKVLANDPDLSREERMTLLLLVVAPGLFEAVER